MTTWLSLILLHFLWQGFAIGALAAWAMSASGSARSRYAFGVAGLAAMATAPLITAAFLFTTGSDAAPAAAVVLADPRWADLLVAGWASGVGGLTVRSLVDAWLLLRLRRTSLAAPPALQARFEVLAQRLLPERRVSLGLVSGRWSAMATGVFRPMVLLPVSALTALEPDQIEAVLAHELAHLRRHDPLVNLLQVALETTLFYHPMVWWLSGAVRDERERCCDDEAVAVTGDAIRYARALTELEAARALVLAPAANEGDFVARIERVLGLGPARPRADRRAPLIAMGATCSPAPWPSLPPATSPPCASTTWTPTRSRSR
jgi:beta-lactamase regulating signal transducer with metallopeptidase domain